MGYPRWQREKMAEERKRELAESAEATPPTPEPEQVAEPEGTGPEASTEATAEGPRETEAATEEPVQDKPRRRRRNAPE